MGVCWGKNNNIKKEEGENANLFRLIRTAHTGSSYTEDKDCTFSPKVAIAKLLEALRHRKIASLVAKQEKKKERVIMLYLSSTLVPKPPLSCESLSTYLSVIHFLEWKSFIFLFLIILGIIVNGGKFN